MALTAKGFLFDLDGTLADSLHVVERAWLAFARRIGADEDEVKHFIHGKPAVESIRHFLPDADENEIAAQLAWVTEQEIRESDQVTDLPGEQVLLARLTSLDIPWAIVTSGSVAIARPRHSAANLPEPDAWVTADNITRGKPDPQPYLLGAEKLGLAPRDCFVFEDATAGLLSGLDAGCQVIAVHVPAGTPRTDELAMRVDSLTEIEVEKAADGTVTLTRRPG
ncbi:phosphatase [Morganella sp. HMSC11D09]|uniref:sugar phosphatase n=1 Tax=Morganella sp. HMSC11D09 TaxID=1581087 RepID=UPI0008A23572|nr:sugar phosphatase [Morganella sp. HMSC11D09]OFU98310.1 phosphatase [Morganella sp. HMSC11D09]